MDGEIEGMEVMSSWQAAMYKAFYEQQLKEQQETRANSAAKGDPDASINASSNTPKLAQQVPLLNNRRTSLATTDSETAMETGSSAAKQPRKRSAGLLKSIVLKSRFSSSNKTSKT